MMQRIKIDCGSPRCAMLDAQRQLYPVQDEEIVAREQALLHPVSLYKALGGEWSAPRYDASML